MTGITAAARCPYAPMFDRAITPSLISEDRPVPDGELLTAMLRQITGPAANRVELVWLP